MLPNEELLLLDLYSSKKIAKFYTKLKIPILPLKIFNAYVPKHGKILDFGTGYGYIANYLSIVEPNRKIIGVDIEMRRILSARRTIGTRKNIDFVQADILNSPELDNFDAITMADVLHHIPFAFHIEILKALWSKLKDNGLLILRETNKKKSLRYYVFNYFSELLLYLLYEKCNFYSSKQLKGLIKEIGFTIESELYNEPTTLYETVILICKKV